MQLKKTDLYILSSLVENSRKSNREIAKQIKISKETVGNRINYLIENEYIKSFSLKVNYEKLGFNEYNLFVKFKKITDEIITELILFLDENPNVTWIGKCFGKYDLKIALIFKNISEINIIINQISSKFGKNIELIDSIYIIDKYKSRADIFFNENIINDFKTKKNQLFIKSQLSIKSLTNKTEKEKKIVLDNIDKSIIYHLGQNPKKSYVELSNIVKLTAEGVKLRVKKLEKEKIILGNSIVINGNKFNKIWCLVILNINPEKNEQFKSYLQNQTFLSSYAESIGYWNFNVTFFASNIEELYQELNQIRNVFAENIRNFDFLIFFEIYKYPKIPKCILNNN